MHAFRHSGFVLISLMFVYKKHFYSLSYLPTYTSLLPNWASPCLSNFTFECDITIDVVLTPLALRAG